MIFKSVCVCLCVRACANLAHTEYFFCCLVTNINSISASVTFIPVDLQNTGCSEKTSSSIMVALGKKISENTSWFYSFNCSLETITHKCTFQSGICSGAVLVVSSVALCHLLISFKL